MPEEYDNDLLKEGILHFKAKEYALARSYFERALDAADDLQTQAQANYYLSQVVDDPKQKRQFLEETLAIDMGHAGARRLLAILDGKLDPAGIVNPDALPPAVAGTREARADRFTCPKCGGRMVFSPDGSTLVCENCSTRQDLNAGLPSSDRDFFTAMADGKGFRRTVSTKTFRCQGCGANFLLAPTDITAICAYCGSIHVLALDEAVDLLAPDAVIPMVFDKKQAAGYLAQWLKEKRLVSQSSLESPRGIYQPVWAFELIGNVPWSGRVIRNKREVATSGECPANFNEVLVPGSTKLGGLFLELLLGFSLASAQAYDSRYLAGWPAQVYEMTMSDAALEARRITVERILLDIRAENGSITDLSYSTSSLSITSYRLILVPVWLADYSLKAKPYRAVVNGQTGAVLGEIPRHAVLNRLEKMLDS